MADSAPQPPPIPVPTDAEAAALQTACDYLHRAGTQAATHLLGCPPLTSGTASIAEFSNLLLTGAALCTGLLDLADEHRHR